MAKKMTHEQVENQMVTMMLYNIQSIYKNKSSDEYKMCGDITKSPEYKSIEKMIADLKTLRGYPKNEAQDIATMFATLHKPVFKECVESYLKAPDDRNSLYTAMFTVGYRVLVGELARIYTSTEATDKGLVYKPDKISRRGDIAAFIKSYDKDLNKRIDEYIRDKNAGQVKEYAESFKAANETFVTESYLNFEAINVAVYQEALRDVGNAIMAGVDQAFGIVGAILNPILGAINFIFKGFKEINPLSFINAILMNSYQKKVDAFHDTVKAYEETKKAYEEYMKLPASKRKPEVEEKYKRMIESYNIAVEDRRAAIKDYDQRAIAEKEQQEQKFPTIDPDGGPNEPRIPDESTQTSTPSDDDIGF